MVKIFEDIPDVDLEKPRYDQTTYWGRARHFFEITNPLNLLATEEDLDRAKTIVDKVRKKELLDVSLSEDDIWRAKVLYDSAFHPDTGEKMTLIGRMSAQVPCNMLITGSMVTFYRTTTAVVFWQWVNQSFNAIVNYTNRGGDSKISEKCKEKLEECLTEEEIWKAKVLYQSAFHPSTGEKMNLIGRMSAQVPCNMFLVGGMLTFYQSNPAIFFWQWLNQSFNALVNYTNRSADMNISNKQLFTTYLLATGGAVGTAVGLNKLTRCMPPLVGRCVPFVAVAAANCVNVPLMRSQELKYGTPVFDENNNKLGNSREAAASGISQVIVSRIAMAMPGMIAAPIIMDQLEKRGTLCRYPWMSLPLQLAIVGLCLTFATPLACAFFKQNAEIKFKRLEPELQEAISKKFEGNPPKVLYYNKGL